MGAVVFEEVGVLVGLDDLIGLRDGIDVGFRVGLACGLLVGFVDNASIINIESNKDKMVLIMLLPIIRQRSCEIKYIG